MVARPCRIRAQVQRRVAATVGVLAVAALTAGCGFVSALAHPAAPPTGVAESSRLVPATSAPSSTAAVASAGADLVASSYARPASLKVTVTGVQPGVPPISTMRGSLAVDCHLTADAAEYVTVSIVVTDRGPADSKEQVHDLGHVIGSNLRLDLSVAGGPGLGVFDLTFKPTGYCNGDPVLPTRTTLQCQDLAGEHQSMTVYVLARIGAAGADPLQGATLQIRDPRRNPDALNPDPWTWHVERVTAGSACAGDHDSLCVPLG
jgi:hypothetical protein